MTAVHGPRTLGADSRLPVPVQLIVILPPLRTAVLNFGASAVGVGVPRIELEIVNAHPTASAVRTVIDALEANDVVVAGAGLRIHVASSHRWGRVILLKLRWAHDDFRLDQ